MLVLINYLGSPFKIMHMKYNKIHETMRTNLTKICPTITPELPPLHHIGHLNKSIWLYQAKNLGLLYS